MAMVIRLSIAKLLFVLFLSSLSMLSAREVKILFSNMYPVPVCVGYSAFDTDLWRYVHIDAGIAIVVPRAVPDDQLFNLTVGVAGRGVARHGFVGISEQALGSIETLGVELHRGDGNTLASFFENVLLPAPTVLPVALAGARRTLDL